MADQKNVMQEGDASLEVEKWLDYKRISSKDRVKFANNVLMVAEAIVSGDLSLDSDSMVLTQKLKFPLTDLKDPNKVVLGELRFAPRITVGELHAATSGQSLSANDFDGKTLAYISALTSTAVGMIKKLDPVDAKIGQAISVFFM